MWTYEVHMCKNFFYDMISPIWKGEIMKYFTFDEAAKQVCVARSTIYMWTRMYGLHYIKIRGVSRIPEDYLDEFLHKEDFKY